VCQLYVDAGRPTTGGDMGRQPASELIFIAAHRKAQNRANVTPVTLQLGQLDRLYAA